MKTNNDFTQGPVGSKLFALTVPMVFGMFSIVIFNLIDAFFVSRLGTKELAALGFTFPVVMFIGSIALGLGIAASSLVSRAIGRGDYHKVKRLATDTLILSGLIVVIFVVIGLFAMDKIFVFLGASPEIIILIKQYMRIWCIGIIFVVIPMVGNNVIRACGDTLTPSIIMVISALINIILDPLLIFGLAGFPRLGLKGAAIATVIARAFTFVLSLCVLHFKERIIDFSLPKFKSFVESCKKILYIGIPSAGSRVLFPLTMAVIMRFVSQYGSAAIAAVGVAIRVEMFVLMAVMALAAVLVPFIGQNWGAKKFVRVRKACSKAYKFAIWWGGGNFILLLIFGVFIGKIFSNDINVSKNITYYLWIMPFSYGLRSVSMLTESGLNAVNRPLLSSALSVIHMIGLAIPLAYLGSLCFGLVGIFLGLCLANIISGLITIRWGKRVIYSQK